jgi:hypothetical protein
VPPSCQRVASPQADAPRPHIRCDEKTGIQGALRPEQGVLKSERPVHRHLRRSVTSDQLGRPRLSAPDGRLPLPIRSQNWTPLRCAVCRSPGWSPEVTATRFSMLLAGFHQGSGLSAWCADMPQMAAGERAHTGVNETQTKPRSRRPACRPGWAMVGAARPDTLGDPRLPGANRAAYGARPGRRRQEPRPGEASGAGRPRSPGKSALSASVCLRIMGREGRHAARGRG